MTEQEWLTSGSPQRLYAEAREVALRALKSGRRRLRLYACACCRQAWGLLGSNGRAAVETAEGYADGRVPLIDFRHALHTAWAPLHPGGALSRQSPRRAAHYAAVYACRQYITQNARQAAVHARRAIRDTADNPRTAFIDAGRLQCDLLRDIFGNPFRPVRARRVWRSWDGGTVRKIAQAIYDERAFERLPVLADALEDAGCTKDTLLSHLRGPGPHVRGCWALDLLRGEA